MVARPESADLSQNPMALEVYDMNMKRSIKVEVIEPVTITARESTWARSTSFTSYNILIETNHWAFNTPFSSVCRRFSEFVWLRSKLQAHHPNKLVPPLPKKRIFSSRNPQVIEERRFGLGKFLQRVMRSSELLSDAALHLFLQSDMDVMEIERKLAENGVKPGSQKAKGAPPRPYLLRSLSSGSSGSSEADFNEGENELSETEQNDSGDLQVSANNKRKLTFRPETPHAPLIINDKVSLVITHENEDLEVEVPNSPMEPPILSSLIFHNSATESTRQSRKFQLPLPLLPLPVQIPVK